MGADTEEELLEDDPLKMGALFELAPYPLLSPRARLGAKIGAVGAE